MNSFSLPLSVQNMFAHIFALKFWALQTFLQQAVVNCKANTAIYPLLPMLHESPWVGGMKNSNYFPANCSLLNGAGRSQCACSPKQMVVADVLSHVLSRKATMGPKPTEWHPKNWEAFQSWWESAISKHCAKCKQWGRPVAFLASPPISIKPQKDAKKLQWNWSSILRSRSYIQASKLWEATTNPADDLSSML